MGTTIPFSYHASVKEQIRYMKNPQSSFLYKAWSRKNTYFRVFEEVLDRKQMPDEIKYLSIVESLLSANAVSWCGATGLWQFMPATGKMMDLTIDSELDERKDVYKSTEKACDYLLEMYKTYNDWLLALAAYNGGPGNVNKAIRRSGGKKTFWEIRKYLPRETQNYVPKFLATAFLMTYSPPAESESTCQLLSTCETLVPVSLCCEVDMKYVCALVEISEDEQFQWNSFYKNGIIPAGFDNKKLVLPYEKAMKVAEYHDSIYLISKNSFNPSDYFLTERELKYHKVSSGQSIYSIATKYNVSVSSIKRWNHLKYTKLKAGKTLKIYVEKQVRLELKSSDLGFLYYISDHESMTLEQLCEGFSEFDLERTAKLNGLDSIQTPIGKGKLIRLYFKLE